MATYSFVANSLILPRINSVVEYKDGVDEIAFNHGGMSCVMIIETIVAVVICFATECITISILNRNSIRRRCISEFAVVSIDMTAVYLQTVVLISYSYPTYFVDNYHIFV